MNTTMITATNTMSELQKQLDIIGNNMANIDTTGYKSKDATFTDLLVQQINNQPNANLEAGRLTPNGIRQGSGAKIGQVQMDMSQGTINSTGRDLDSAFQKEGQYYKVLVQNGNTNSVQYTRDGNFSFSPVAANEVMLVTKEGYPVLDENNNPITVNGTPSKIAISQNGTMGVTTTNGRTQAFNLGVIQVNNPAAFVQEGNNMIGLPANTAAGNAFTNMTGAQRNQISIQQGALEQSNVDMSKEMTKLINMQRSYQFQSRAVSMADQMMGLTNGIR